MARNTSRAGNSGGSRSFGDVVRDIGRSIARDVSMGASAGLGSSERRTSNLSRAGYTQSEIRDFEARTAATMERNRELSDRRDRDRPAAAAAAPPPPPAAEPVAPPAATTPVPPAAPAPVDLAAPTTSEAEAAAVESTQGGRASTILTSAQGLLAEEEPTGLLRPRQSLMSRGLIK